jgi:hypothetical protein
MSTITKAVKNIDWARIAEPQQDQYDTDVILTLAMTTTSLERPAPYVRTPIGDAPTVFDGSVAVRYVYHNWEESDFLATHYLDAPLNHSNLKAAAELVRTWPVAFEQCKRVLDSIHPAIDPRIPFIGAEIYRGSACHSYGRLFGTMWTTIHCPYGTAEAIVHEMAHQKLRALGLSFEHATCIVANDPSERYESPIVKDRLRPMTAVVHAEYSYVHVTNLDIRMIAAEGEEARRAALLPVLTRNVARIQEGYDTIQKHFRPGLHGAEFMSSFSDWTRRTIQTAHQTVAQYRN